MIRIRTVLLCSLFILLASGVAFAEEDPLKNAPGEVRIKMNIQYASAEVDGQAWESTEFMDDGKTIVIKDLNRSVEHSILLTASDDDLAPIEMTIPANSYKKTRKKRTVFFIVKRKVNFKRKPPEPKAVTPAPSEM